MRTFAILLAFSLSVFGQRHKLDVVDAQKPEGQLLQKVMQEDDPAKKAALMEQYASQFPKTAATPWVLEQLQGIYVKAQDPDKIIATGDKLLALDPGDPEAALQCLKAAEARHDVALIEKYDAVTSANARKMAAAPKPAAADAVADWRQSVDYARQVDNYADYALYSAALESRGPKATIALGEMLLQRSPTSDYAAKVREPLFVAYEQSGANDKAIGFAEQTLAKDQSSEDMLLAVAYNYLQKKEQPEKVHAYSAKAIELMAARQKPAGMSDADWTARKNAITGRAYYLDGAQYFAENKFAPADQSLRKALPLVETNKDLKPEALYLLGVSDYKLEKIQDAANYFHACAAIQSRFQAEATKDLARIRRDYRGVK